jgi:hypothetical protein
VVRRLDAASLILVPVLLKYRAVQGALGLARTPGEMVLFSAKPDSFVHASGMLAFWPASGALTTEEFLFPGITAVALVAASSVAGIRRWRRRPSGRSPLVFYASAALIVWALAFGPSPPDSPWFRPYDALVWLPGFDALRVPARFAMLATLCLGIAAGLAFARLAPERPARLRLFAACAIAGLAMDGWMRAMPLAIPPGRVILPEVPDAVVLELPANEGEVDTAAMFRAMLHRRPIVNGYSGHTPPHYMILSLALRRSDPSVLTELARGRPLAIIVNYAHDPGADYLRLVEGLPGIQALGGSSAGAVFVLPPLPAARVPPIGEAWPASIRQSGTNGVVMDLGVIRAVRTVGFALRWHCRELDPRIAVEISPDGSQWSTVWEDWTGGPAFAAALRNPLEAPVRLTLPDVRARYLRVHPVPPWLARELRAFGPE